MFRARVVGVLAALGFGIIPIIGGTFAAAPDPALAGAFLAPFNEPVPNCPQDDPNYKPDPTKPPATAPCRPAAVNLMYLPNGKVLYWDGLEGMENVPSNTTGQIGIVSICDQARVMTIKGTPTWKQTIQSTGLCAGANNPPSWLVPGLITNQPGQSSAALFCSDQVFLANGQVMTTGGTNYYEEPNIPGTNYGVSELEGIKWTRIYDPKTNSWSRSGDMHYGRWYPSLVTLGNGQVFVASGVTKLLKPVYPDHPFDSGTNVRQTEIYNPITGTWDYTGPLGDHSLPLYPRLHLLPDGKVYYDGGGQTFNPFGQSYDEATWNMNAVFDPATRTWTSLGIPGLGTLSPGFRGSGFSVMLPLKAPYDTASFLSGGGVLGVTPGTYLATASTEINSVKTGRSGDVLTTAAGGNLVNARWYSTAVVLPDGSVMAFSGANRDEVVGPGTGNPIRAAERYDPATNTWTAMASALDGRTYHNTAILLPTGEVLVGGHSPINTLYGAEFTIPGGFSNNFRDSTFEIYQPPYLSWGPRPVITRAPHSVNYGTTISLGVSSPSDIVSAVLIRQPSVTHLVDGDQREVQLPIISGSGGRLTLGTPPSGDVAPPGPYLLFVLRKSDRGLIPSVAAQVFVGAQYPAWAAQP